MKPFIRETTMADIHAVMSDLSDISAEEVLRDGRTWWQAISITRDLRQQGPADTLVWDGEPIALFGHVPSRNPYTRYTWFRCRPAYFRHGLRTTVISRKYLKTLQDHYPGVTFDSFTSSRHPGCVRWFSLMGYEFLGDYNGQAALFRLKPAEKAAPRVENRDTVLPTPA